MDHYIDAPLWEIPHTSSYPQIANDDLLALLQKQFANGNTSFEGGFVDGVNPQNISRYPLPSITPPSEDSSPSPPNLNQDTQSLEDGADAALKRKASEEDMEEGPSSKAQHTGAGAKKTTMNRRKSTSSGTPKDEGRLLKRKEQNRAAQRAFRERKEKHVKDLEDKVAALEAKNEQATHENDNLRDLLARLQNENMALKQGSFTFTMPKPSTENAQASTSSFAPQGSEFASSSRSPTSASVASTSSGKSSSLLDWNSLTSFDPAMLNLLDDRPQPTATDGARQLDFGFGTAGLTPNAPYTTIASNPVFMSYASAFDSALPVHNTSDQGSSFFDMNGLTWSPPPQPQQQHQESSSLDELFAGYMSRGLDYSFMSGPPSVAAESPVTHHANVNGHLMNNAPSQSPASSSSPSSCNSDPLFDHRDSPASDSDHDLNACPKTKGEMGEKIKSLGLSPFAPLGTNLRKSDNGLGTMISCAGTNLPKTQKSDHNIEVLSAWRSITSNPKFKDVDIDRLCTEFTSKAKCDGTKVVLEPHGVDSIIKNLSGTPQ